MQSIRSVASRLLGHLPCQDGTAHQQLYVGGCRPPPPPSLQGQKHLYSLDQKRKGIPFNLAITFLATTQGFALALPSPPSTIHLGEASSQAGPTLQPPGSPVSTCKLSKVASASTRPRAGRSRQRGLCNSFIEADLLLSGTCMASNAELLLLPYILTAIFAPLPAMQTNC